MLPVLAGFIAMSIGDRPALAVGFVGGMIAANGKIRFPWCVGSRFPGRTDHFITEKSIFKIAGCIGKDHTGIVIPRMWYPADGTDHDVCH